MTLYQRVIKLVLPWKNKEDWCSFWPDGIWGECCKQHDYDYKYGEVSKIEADTYLLECIIAAGKPTMGCIMFLGLQILGYIGWFKWRIRDWIKDNV